MRFKIGHKVSILDENVEGIVMGITPKGNVIVAVDGFDYEYPEKKLVNLMKNHSIEVGRSDVYKKELSHLDRLKSEKFQTADGTWELDLHFHEIADEIEQKKIPSEKKLMYQLEYFKKVLEKASYCRVKRLIVIHGVGEGILKAQIREVLIEKGIVFQDASMKHYGWGATEIELYY